MILTERTSKQDPPVGVMFEALAQEVGRWWVSVEGEREPVVVSADPPREVTYTSPFLWRPSDVITLSLERFDAGCKVYLRHSSDAPFGPMEASAIKHRWGEHLDRDLRDRFDQGGRPDQYAVSLYRGDVDDWAIVDSVLGRSWQAIEPLPVQVRTTWAGRSHIATEHELRADDVIWAVEMGRHRTSVGCLPERPADLEVRLTPQRPGVGRNAEIFVPLAEFRRRLREVPSEDEHS